MLLRPLPLEGTLKVGKKQFTCLLEFKKVLKRNALIAVFHR